MVDRRLAARLAVQLLRVHLGRIPHRHAVPVLLFRARRGHPPHRRRVRHHRLPPPRPALLGPAPLLPPAPRRASRRRARPRERGQAPGAAGRVEPRRRARQHGLHDFRRGRHGRQHRQQLHQRARLCWQEAGSRIKSSAPCPASGIPPLHAAFADPRWLAQRRQPRRHRARSRCAAPPLHRLLGHEVGRPVPSFGCHGQFTQLTPTASRTKSPSSSWLTSPRPLSPGGTA